MSAAEILVPAKFVSQMVQLIITCVIYQSQYENLLNYPNDQLAESSQVHCYQIKLISWCHTLGHISSC
ncbi:unnamed protein product (macronuclear) [Paramecium tetraurelia]|uniref:Uncharacterized protein n=1 Tax=Paramecium tetraurelia TaxID=5888 RepID=A0C474_PARTE|nr:uncharacterized protein GSPATT00035071001 [Paramecium tetraurelia]CAK65591.1 unnamed protein product [Paramecium tetraurelia]|eukprot:XP_001432988.1 hypothetical protein (macronuclear) [Paramecium tetraurelia strain d4-2]